MAGYRLEVPDFDLRLGDRTLGDFTARERLDSTTLYSQMLEIYYELRQDMEEDLAKAWMVQMVADVLEAGEEDYLEQPEYE